MKKVVAVGLAEIKVVNEPNVLVAHAIGSCVAVIFYDYKTKVAGLAHVMLPSKNGFAGQSKQGKFADIAIGALMTEMIEHGAKKNRIIAKIAGGACMFKKKSEDYVNVGQRNVDKIKEILKNLKISLKAEDTGGNYARTVRFYSDNGKATVSSARLGIKDL